MSIATSQALGSARRTADIESCLTELADQPAEAIMASVMRSPGRARLPDGVCACALAFSTLLSSQGADAHPLRHSNLIRGNPANLPVLPRAVNRSHSTDCALTWCYDQDRTTSAGSQQQPRFRVTTDVRGLAGHLRTGRLRRGFQTSRAPWGKTKQ